MKCNNNTSSLGTFKRDSAETERLLKNVERIETVEGIKRGLEGMKQNTGKPAERFFEEFFIEKGIPERE